MKTICCPDCQADITSSVMSQIASGRRRVSPERKARLRESLAKAREALKLSREQAKKTAWVKLSSCPKVSFPTYSPITDRTKGKT